MLILKIAIPLPIHNAFDYLLPLNIKNKKIIGCRAKIPLGKKNLVGIIISIHNSTSLSIHKIKYIHEIIDSYPLFDKDLLNTLLWASYYYKYPVGKTIFQFIPKKLKKNKIPKKKVFCNKKNVSLYKILYLNNEQNIAYKMIFDKKNKFVVWPLSNISKIARNNLYIKIIKNNISFNKQTLILFPEQELIYDTYNYIKTYLNITIDIFSSKLTYEEKKKIYSRIQYGKTNLVIGTRSALFVHFFKLGFIIIEDEHNIHYKEKKGLLYHARDMAIYYAKIKSIPIIISSNTLSLETILNIKKGKYKNLIFNNSLSFNKINKKIINLNNIESNPVISKFLIDKIKFYLNENKKIFIFINKKGFASSLVCKDCNWILECKKCDNNFTVYEKYLKCHYCNNKSYFPDRCLQCNSKNLFFSGLGIEQIKKKLSTLFSKIKTFRIDNNNKKIINLLYKKKQNYQNDNYSYIFLSTTICLKKLDFIFHIVSLIVFIDIDNIILNSNFRAIEKFSQNYNNLISKFDKKNNNNKELIIQTKLYNNNILDKIIKLNYYDFSNFLLEKRKKMMLPPFTYHAIFFIKNKNFYKTINFLQKIRKIITISALNKQNFVILGPISSYLLKINDIYKCQLLIQHQSRNILHKVLNNVLLKIQTLSKKKKIICKIDIDPINY